MSISRPLLLAGPLALILALVPGRASADSAAAFDALFKQLDDEHIKQLTPEESKTNLARLHALIPPGDARRELLHRSLVCLEPPEDVQASLDYAKRGLAEAELSGDVGLQARFLYCVAAFQEMVGNSREVIGLHSRAIALSRKADDPQLLGDGFVLRGNVRSFLGEYAAALADFMAAQRVYESARLKDRVEANLQNIGVTYRRMGEFDRARDYLERSRAIALREEDWFSVLASLMQLGFMHEDMREPDKALAVYTQGLRIAQAQLSTYHVGAAYLGMASAHLGRRAYGDALVALRNARSNFAAIGTTSDDGMLAMLEAQARTGLGQYTQAAPLFERARVAFEAERNDRYLALLYPARAEMYEAMGNVPAALADYKRASMLREKLIDARNDQRGLMLRQQFDESRRAIESKRAKSEKMLRAGRADAQSQARRWRWLAMGSTLALIGVLGALVAQQLLRTRRLRVRASTDSLTGVASRARLASIGAELIGQAHADGRALGVVAVQIDDIRALNEAQGHLVVDRVIARVADACRGALRQLDEIGRSGGQAFAVLLPDADRDATARVAARIRAAVDALRWDDLAPGLQVGVRVGMTVLEASDASLDAVIARAEAAAPARGRREAA